VNRYRIANPIIAIITIATQFLGSLKADTKVSIVEFNEVVTPDTFLNFSKTIETITITIARVPQAMTSFLSLSPIPIFVLSS